MRVYLFAKLLDAHVRAEEYYAQQLVAKRQLRCVAVAQKKKLQRADTDPANAASSVCSCGHKISLRNM